MSDPQPDPTPTTTPIEPDPADSDPADSVGAAAAPAAGATPRRRAEAYAFLEVLALCGFVVAQPVLDIIGGAPAFLIFHGVETGGILLLVALLTLAPPALLWAVGALSGLAGPRVRRVVHLVTLGLLLAAFAVQLGKHLTPVRGAVLAGMAVLVAVAVLATYRRWQPLRQLVRFAAVGPVVFALLFTFASPASAVILAGDEPQATAPTQATGPHPPVVFILLDEFPLHTLLTDGGEIDTERFPNFARLAGDATWYRNATTLTGWSPFAIPALLTGNPPVGFVAPHYSLYPDNLFTLFGQVYTMEVNESITHLCPPQTCEDRGDDGRGGLPVALTEVAGLLGEMLLPVEPERDPRADFAEPVVADVDEPDLDDPAFMFDRAHDNQPARFQDFQERLAQPATGHPTLHFLHLLLPHIPWTYFPSGVRYHDQPVLPLTPEEDAWWGALSIQRLELQLEYTDHLLGEVLDLLAGTGRYDETLLVLTADHGMVLDPAADVLANGRQLHAHHEDGVAELAWVPTFIKEPGQATGVVDDRNWLHTDLLPTIADLAGIEVPWPTEGISWVREERVDSDKPYLNLLHDERVLDGDAILASILANPGPTPELPPHPLPELIGTAVADLPIEPGSPAGTLGRPELFADVPADGRTVPALVYGYAPMDLPLGTPVAIAVNGVIGAVAPVAELEGNRWYGGLVEDYTMFQPGPNQVDVYEVVDQGAALRLIATIG